MNKNDDAIESLAHELWTFEIFGPPHAGCPYQTAKGKRKDENADYANSCDACREHLLEVARVVVESGWLTEIADDGATPFRSVATLNELNQLPVGSVIRRHRGNVWR